MQMILLLQPEHRPIPDTIEVQEFGHETIRAHDTTIHSGVSALCEGPKEAFIEWLKPFDGVWTTLSPLTGPWEVCHIKTEQEQT